MTHLKQLHQVPRSNVQLLVAVESGFSSPPFESRPNYRNNLQNNIFRCSKLEVMGH